MTTTEAERPINQNPIHVDADEFDAIVARMGQDAFNQRFTVHLGAESDKATVDTEAAPDTEPYGQRVSIVGYVPGETLEAIVTGSKDDPNRPGMKLFFVKPANPADAEGFPSVAPQENLVASMVQEAEQPETARLAPDASLSESEVDVDALKMGPEERRRNRAILDARAATEAAYATVQPQGEVAPEAEQVAPSAKEEVNKFNNPADIAIYRAINDYDTYMGNADRLELINGSNKDNDNLRARAEKGIAYLPTAIQNLARRYYEENKEK